MINLIILMFLDDGLDEVLLPESLVPGEKYVVQYGTTQVDTKLGINSRDITVLRQGLSSEMDYHRVGRPVYRGVWVIQ